MNDGLIMNDPPKRPVSPRKYSAGRKTSLVGSIVQVRWVKPYAEAHNHLAIGCVLEESLNYIKVNCRTIHYRGWGNQSTVGCIAVRIIPWNRVEVIHELKERFPWKEVIVTDDEGNLRVGKNGPIVVSRSNASL